MKTRDDEGEGGEGFPAAASVNVASDSRASRRLGEGRRVSETYSGERPAGKGEGDMGA